MRLEDMTTGVHLTITKLQMTLITIVVLWTIRPCGWCCMCSCNVLIVGSPVELEGISVGKC